MANLVLKPREFHRFYRIKQNNMCETKYISSLFVNGTPDDTVRITTRRSDGEIFVSQISFVNRQDAVKVKQLFNYIEELRTCSCTRFSVCERHSELREKSN